MVARDAASLRAVRGSGTAGTAVLGHRGVGSAMTDAPTEDPGSRPGVRPLLIIVAYEAAQHLSELIGRLAQVGDVRERWSVLLLDDASRDRTSERARELFAQHAFSSWRVVRNAENQGYGGNQKVGYRYALKAGRFSHVALLHGDCQYPPEALPAMLDEALSAGADVVVASRVWSARAARRGGVPRLEEQPSEPP